MLGMLMSGAAVMEQVNVFCRDGGLKLNFCTLRRSLSRHMDMEDGPSTTTLSIRATKLATW